MNRVIAERDASFHVNDARGSVWANGVGFGGASVDDNRAKEKRDLMLREQIEREAVLIHAFDIFVSAISLTSSK